MSYFACCHWQAKEAGCWWWWWFAACLALPCPACSVGTLVPKVNPPTHPSVPMAPPPTHGPVPTLTLPGHGRQGHQVLRLGLGSGSLKSVVRACFFASSISRASPLLLLCPCSTPALLHEHDTTSLNKAWFGRRFFFITDHLAAPKPFFPLTSSSTDGGALHPTVSAKKHSRSPRLDRIPTKTQSQDQPTLHDHAGPIRIVVNRTGARLSQLAGSNTRHL